MEKIFSTQKSHKGRKENVRKITTADCINLKTYLERDANTVANPLLVNNFDAIFTISTVDCLRQIKLRQINLKI